ncbi:MULTISPECIES: hypothetical protein [unclassified Nostoc]|uniref:hypothetical protein n=1 Tax=unclassified Nostoc TaxID=2593658 RepID=UPI001F555A4C|nr:MULTISPECIES: hypothetical protein [unclassified Nostoc]
MSSLHKFLIATIKPTSFANNRSTSISVLLWLILSLGFGIFYGYLGLQKAFKSEYVVQDDAREYVFWMQRFVDSELFHNDLIADYFKSITPLGYASVYKLMAYLGINPLLLSKILPIFLGLIITSYCFWLCLEIFPVPLAAFISTLLLNQSLWFKSDLVSATPRSFLYPLILAFLYYLVRESWVSICLVIVFAGLFYPILLFICLGILLLRMPKNYILLATILGLGFLAILPYAFMAAQYGPSVSGTQALTMPEYWPDGRHPFFNDNPWKFWLIGQHSGILPPLLPPFIWMGLFFPMVLQHCDRFPLIRLVNSKIKLLLQIVIVSLILYFAAHALLLKLFFPTRYIVHTIRIVMAIASGITLTVMLDKFFLANQQMNAAGRKRRFWRLGLTIFVAAALFLYPNLSGRFPTTDYRVSRELNLYKFLQQQPKETLVATLADEADNIPTFGQRPILVGREYALPFHIGYYSQIRQRSIDLIRSQYSLDITAAKQLIQNYGVDFWLLERTAFQPEYLTKKTWLKSFQPVFAEALDNLEQGKIPAIAKLVSRCSVIETENFSVLKADCILTSP